MIMKNTVFASAFLFVLAGAAPAGSVVRTDIHDQEGVQVTVYNNNIALIKDLRKVSLPLGEGELRFMDVASHIMPETVYVRSVNSPGDLSILEQNYEYDLMNADKLLDKYVGEKIKIVDWNKQQDRKEVVDAILLSNNKGQIYKINDEIFLGHPGYKVLPKIPENLIAKPTLMWVYENKIETPHKMEVSYLTTNLSWNADYVLLLNEDETSADLTGWVTLDNRSGATYSDAALKLVAGEVHRVEESRGERLYLAEEAKAAGAPQFKEKAFFEYHIYDLQRKTTIKDKQKKQIRLLEAGHVEIQRELLVIGMKSYFTRRYGGKLPNEAVHVYIKFINSKDSNLGMPLPAGIMRLYKRDDDGSQQFIGEDRIEHTPKDEEIKLKMGEAFDVVAERVQTDFRQISTRLYESEWEISLRNHKDKKVEVGIQEPMYGNWQVLSSTHSYEKVDAFTIRFNIEIPKNDEVKVKYRVSIGI